VYVYLYSDPPAAQDALHTIQTFIWGEKHKSNLHPEDIFTAENAVVVVSGEKPGPVTDTLLGGEGTISAKDEAKAEKEFEKGKKAYLKKDNKAAEEHFRAVIQIIPDHLGSRMFLGNALFYQNKFSDAIPEYERALARNEKAKDLSQTEERLLIDNLGMAYGLSGHLDKCKKFYEDAIKKDPSYPDYYYNLACIVAEQGDLDAAITNLKLGFDRRSNSLPGESYSNPRTDDSFKKFLGNEKFEAALKEMGF
jgi:tetratricopeptide (TPR) repeat protein